MADERIEAAAKAIADSWWGAAHPVMKTLEFAEVWQEEALALATVALAAADAFDNREPQSLTVMVPPIPDEVRETQARYLRASGSAEAPKEKATP